MLSKAPRQVISFDVGATFVVERSVERAQKIDSEGVVSHATRGTATFVMPVGVNICYNVLFYCIPLSRNPPIIRDWNNVGDTLLRLPH